MKSEIKIGAVLSYVIIILHTLIGIFFTPVLARMLGQSEYGLYSLVASMISYISILDFGFGNAIVVYTSKYIASKNYEGMSKLHGMFLIIYTIIGIFAAIIGTLLTINTNLFFSNTMSSEEIETAKILIAILTFNIAITFPFSLFSNIIIAHENFIFSKVLSIIRIVSLPICMIPLLLMGQKSIALVILTTVINIGVILTNTIFCFKKLKIKFCFNNFDKKLFWEIVSYSFFIFLAQIVDKINWGVDNFILGVFCGTTSVAIYSVALQFNTAYLNFSTGLTSVMLPKVSKMEAKQESEEHFTSLFIKTGRIQFLIMSLFLTGFIIFGKQFIILLFGQNYEDSFIIACILITPLTIPLIQTIGLSIIQAKNKYRFVALVNVFIAIANVILSVILTQKYDAIGAALGTAISLFIGNFIIINIYYYKAIRLNIPKFWKEIFFMAIPMIIIFIFSYLINSIIGYNGVALFIFEMIIYTLLYCVIAYKFSMNSYEKELFLKPIHRLIRH